MSFNCGFPRYAQKLSGRAKTFQVAMPPCHMGFSDSGGKTRGACQATALDIPLPAHAMPVEQGALVPPPPG